MQSSEAGSDSRGLVLVLGVSGRGSVMRSVPGE